MTVHNSQLHNGNLKSTSGKFLSHPPVRCKGSPKVGEETFVTAAKVQYKMIKNSQKAASSGGKPIKRFADGKNRLSPNIPAH